MACGELPIVEDLVGIFALCLRHVEAGAEVPLARGRHDGDAQRFVVAHVLPDRTNDQLHLRRERVAALGAVESDDRDAVAAAFVANAG